MDIKYLAVLRYLYLNDIIYLDIKLANILLVNSPLSLLAKASNFGLSIVLIIFGVLDQDHVMELQDPKHTRPPNDPIYNQI